MLRIAVCDDMSEFLKSVDGLVSSWRCDGGAVTVSLFDNGYSLIEEHAKLPFDIILLDVVMPLIGGIETAAEIRRSDRSVKLVFLTSSPEFAVESYSVKASNYLLKPIDPEKLYACLDELYYDINEHSGSMVVRDASAAHKIRFSDIEYVEAQGKQVAFFMRDGTLIRASEPFYSYERLLLSEHGFLKCHRSYVVNVSSVETYTPKEITVRSGTRIPISRNAQKTFETAYFEIMFGKAGEIL